MNAGRQANGSDFLNFRKAEPLVAVAWPEIVTKTPLCITAKSIIKWQRRVRALNRFAIVAAVGSA
jgi:hypothetical protein